MTSQRQHSRSFQLHRHDVFLILLVKFTSSLNFHDGFAFRFVLITDFESNQPREIEKPLGPGKVSPSTLAISSSFSFVRFEFTIPWLTMERPSHDV